MRTKRIPTFHCLARLGLGLLVTLACCWTPSGRAENASDATLAPYFVVNGTPAAEGQEETLPLKHTGAKVRVLGSIADVEITQRYRNTGASVLEATYVFPCSTRAAVHGLTMKIGGRVVEAQIREKVKAREEYEKAKSQGKSAALLEQHRPNVFQMHVGHLLPGDDIEVVLRYTELLRAEDRVYEFVFPTVVGPRYSRTPAGSPEAKGDAWVANPYLAPGTGNTTTFDLTMELRTGVPVKDIACKSHAVQVRYQAADVAEVRLDPAAVADAGNRDFVLRYRLAGEQISAGLLTHEDAATGEGTFLLLAEPPARPRPEDIPGREYIFVVDVSGSMAGFPLDTAKSLMSQLLGKLGPADCFDVVLFAGTAAVLAPEPIPATAENVKRGREFLNSRNGGGGTELGKALETALALPPRAESGLSRSVVVITDGYVDFERETFDTVRENLGKANLFAMGIGSAVNRFCIEGLARAGGGEPFVVLDPSEAAAAASKLADFLAAPVLTDVAVDFQGWEISELEPSVLPDLFADRPLAVVGKYRGELPKEIRLRGISGTREVSLPIAVAEAVEKARMAGNPAEALPRLWARSRIARLDDYASLGNEDDVRGEVTELGLKHGLMTRFTSYVAVDTVARPADGLEHQTVAQPLPLPQGVPVTAVGGAAGGTTPEPGLLTLLFGGLAAWWARFRRQAKQA